MILTIPVFLYQALFVLILWVANRNGNTALIVATIACLAWTATHLLFVPLAVLQASVILITAGTLLYRRKASSKTHSLARTDYQ